MQNIGQNQNNIGTLPIQKMEKNNGKKVLL